MKESKVEQLLGKTLKDVINQDDRRLEFFCDDGEVFVMHLEDAEYGNDCSIRLEDVVGDLKDLIGNPILVAECRTNETEPRDGDTWYTAQWTFYEIATIKGSVTLRWYTESSPYYSVSVDFNQVK